MGRVGGLRGQGESAGRELKNLPQIHQGFGAISFRIGGRGYPLLNWSETRTRLMHCLSFVCAQAEVKEMDDSIEQYETFERFASYSFLAAKQRRAADLIL